jgi:hypothetical protein
MSIPTIGLQEALARMSEAGGKPFRITYVRSGEKKQGTVKTVLCYYGAPNPRERSRIPKAPTGEVARAQRTQHLDSGTIPLTEVSTRRMLTLRISHIISFENKQVIH